MPAARFWMLHRNIDRVAAEESIRMLTMGASAQSGEGFKASMDDLRDQMGDVVIYKEGAVVRSSAPESQLDRGGLATLKMMSGQKIGDRVT